MADVSELLLLLSGDASGAKRAISDTSKGLSGLDGSSSKSGKLFSELGKIIVGAMEAAAGVALGAVGSGVAAYVEISDAQDKLNVAMKAAGPQYTQTQAGINKTVGSLNGMGVSTSAVLQAMTKLTEAHVPLIDQSAALTAAQNLATGTGQDFASALQQIIMGSQGMGRGLKQLGLNLPAPVATTLQLSAATAKVAAAQDKATAAEKKYGDYSSQAVTARQNLTAAQDKLAAAQESYNNKFAGLPSIADQVNQRMGGQAAAWTKTLPGVLNELKIKWDNVAYSIGQRVVPYLIKFGNWIVSIEPTVGAFVNGVLTVLGVALGDIGTAIGIIVAHKTEFAIAAGIVAGMFVIGHAQAWANDALSHIKSVFSAITNAPSAVGQFLGFGGATATSKTSAIGSDVQNLAGDVQKVFVVNMAEGGLGNAAGAAEGEAAAGAGEGEAAAGAGEGAAAGGLATFALAGTALLGAALLLQSQVKTNVKRTGGVATSMSNTGGVLGIGDSQGGLFGQGGLLGTGIGGTKDIVAFENAKLKSNLDAAATAAGMSVPHFLAFSQASQDIAKTATDKGAAFGADFVALENHLQAMGLSFGQSASASDALQAYITKYGPLTSAQMAVFYSDVKAGQTSAFDISLSMQTAASNLSSIPASAASIAAGLAALHKAIPTSMNLPTGGVGFFRDSSSPPPPLAGGGLADAPLSGGLAILHGREYVVPESLASPSLRASMAAAIAGKKVGTAIPASLAGAGVGAGDATPTISQTLIFQGVAGQDRTMIRDEIRAANATMVRTLQAGRR